MCMKRVQKCSVSFIHTVLSHTLMVPLWIYLNNSKCQFEYQSAIFKADFKNTAKKLHEEFTAWIDTGFDLRTIFRLWDWSLLLLFPHRVQRRCWPILLWGLLSCTGAGCTVTAGEKEVPKEFIFTYTLYKCASSDNCSYF